MLLSSAALGAISAPLLTAFAQAATKLDAASLDAVQSLLEIERAGIKAYNDAAATGLLSKNVLAVALQFKRDHEAHRDALITAVQATGAVPSSATAHIPYPPLNSEHDILAFAEKVERKAASTYLSVVPDISDKTFAQLLASILGVETTHVAMLAEALGDAPAYPAGFVV